MKTKDFLKKHDACPDGSRWALSISEDMADVWDAMIEQGEHEWLRWTATRQGVFPESVLRKLACRFVRETPLHDGRKVWDLMVDERSRKAVEVAELYADGKATYEELAASAAAAYAAADDDAHDAAHAAADAAAFAAYAATDVAADDAFDVYDADAAAVAAARAAARDARDAADDVAYDVARAAAKAAQVQMIVEMGNPFK